ncbi:hypothetical protein DYH09_04105 [bacterium CPR1]|nr:hypothetical protein [bacterium CPR1]
MQNIATQGHHEALKELLGGEIPAPLAELVHRRDTARNDLVEYLTAVESEGTRQALRALFELHQEEIGLLLAVMQQMHKRA